MNKTYLKDGMVVELRNGKKEVVWVNDLYEIHALQLTVTNCLNNYNDDLYYTFTDDKRSLDIMKVSYNNELLWKREKEIDWSKVPVGTKVLVSANEKDWFTSYFIKKLSPIEDTNFYVINIRGELNEWEYCKLAEELKEEVTFDDIDKKLDFYCINHNKICDQACGPCVTKNILENYNVTRKDNK
ncbi:hypothetical protein TPDSL_23080 [Terrisporobacter petrolearius]|uniref:hypothetical protein n=1 Tax=Terrisporobacter petrolearius TaxID=1460447 RepID=UPI003366BAA0